MFIYNYVGCYVTVDLFIPSQKLFIDFFAGGSDRNLNVAAQYEDCVIVLCPYQGNALHGKNTAVL